MIRFERSTDYALIRSIITTPAVFRHLTDDNSPSAEDYQPIEHEAIWYVIVRDSYCGDEELLGLWMFHPLNSICWEVHTALLPNAWGEYRDRGIAHAEQGNTAAAVRDLETYLAHAEDALDVDAIAERVAALRRAAN